MGEVLDWFDRCGLEFVRGVPTLTPLDPQVEGGLFERVSAGGTSDHFLAQLQQIKSGSREGGFFILIGRKKAASSLEAA